MLISHRYRFIYTKTVKTAGTSVESFFERFCMPEGEWTQSHARDVYESPSGVIGFRGPGKPQDDAKWWNHMSASSIQKQIGLEVWNNYFKFCVVRNPFDKCISAFCHRGKNHSIGKQSILSRILNQGLSSEQLRFIDYLQKRAPIDRNKYLIDNEFCLDDVIRYESLETDLERICQRIGLPFDKAYLPAFKAGIRNSEATIESLYTKRAIALVKEKYAFELQYFGYEFPSLLLSK
jgi:Sulfotransferase family